MISFPSLLLCKMRAAVLSCYSTIEYLHFCHFNGALWGLIYRERLFRWIGGERIICQTYLLTFTLLTKYHLNRIALLWIVFLMKTLMKFRNKEKPRHLGLVTLMSTKVMYTSGRKKIHQSIQHVHDMGFMIVVWHAAFIAIPWLLFF